MFGRGGLQPASAAEEITAEPLALEPAPASSAPLSPLTYGDQVLVFDKTWTGPHKVAGVRPDGSFDVDISYRFVAAYCLKTSAGVEVTRSSQLNEGDTCVYFGRLMVVVKKRIDRTVEEEDRAISYDLLYTRTNIRPEHLKTYVAPTFSSVCGVMCGSCFHLCGSRNERTTHQQNRM